MNEYHYTVTLPGHHYEQNEEYFILAQNGHTRTFKLHEYSEIYKFPKLYEYVLIDLLKEASHEVMPALLAQEVLRAQCSVADLAVLEVGAGTGLIGEGLRKQGVRTIVGIDILEEAAEAAQRDRPGVYSGYYVKDLSQLTPSDRKELEAVRFNCLVCVSAASYHIPPSAFRCAYNLIADNGWIMFNLKEKLLEECPKTGAIPLLNRIIEEGILDITVKHEYQHRIAVDGTPIMYVGIVGRKRTNIPEDMKV